MLRNNHELNEIYKGKIQVDISAETAVFPTIQECAALSEDAYNVNDSHEMPPGWECPLTSKIMPSGYYGKMYVKCLNINNYVVVFSHRGTVFTDPRNLWGDFQLAIGNYPHQTLDAYNFVIAGLMFLGWLTRKGVFIRGTVTQTGHSIGAVMADAASGVLSVFGDIYIDQVIQCITFENPGSLKAVTDFWSQIHYPENVVKMLDFLKLKSVSLMREVNAINTCEPHIGKTLRIKNSSFNDFKNEKFLPFPPSVHFSSNFHYLTDYLFDQHGMLNIIKQINNADFSYEEKVYPSTYQEAYVDYLNPLNDQYWNGYFESMWENDTTGLLHLKYGNDFNKCKQHLFLELTAVYEDAKKSLTNKNEKSFGNSYNMFKSTNEIVKEFHLIEKEEKIDKSSYCKTM